MLPKSTQSSFCRKITCHKTFEEPRAKPGLSITQDLNKIRKNPKHPIVDIGKLETGAKFQQKILNSMVVGACQCFQFFRQITGFLRNNGALSKFKYWISHHLDSIIKFQNS